MKRCVIDTNVLLTANKAVAFDTDDDVAQYPELISGCIELLLKIKRKRIYVVLDTDDEIFSEYKYYFDFSGQPGVGDVFFKWLHDTRFSFPESERVVLHKTVNSYLEFPCEMKSIGVDPSDKKFFAVSNAHPSKPDIYEATDAKWWNWAETAIKCGLHIIFMDEGYMRDHN